MTNPSFSCAAFILFLTAGVIIEEVENEKEMENRGISEEDPIGVVFKDDFSYCLRFQSHRLAHPNDAFQHFGNKINEISELYFKKH